MEVMMDAFDSVLGAITKTEWVSDRLTLAGISARHIGRVVTFDYMLSDDPDNYDSERIIGALDGADGTGLFVAGGFYEYDKIANLKVWRREVKK